MRGEPFLERLKKNSARRSKGPTWRRSIPGSKSRRPACRRSCLYFRDEPDLRFNLLNCISGVDYCEPDPKKAAKAGFEPHMEVVYHLWSLPHKTSMVLKLVLPRWKNDTPGELPEVPTVSDIWRTADWHEREVYDLSGVWFTGRTDLRRILCPEDWVGHPLRKDYEMPLEYHGIRGR